MISKKILRHTWVIIDFDQKSDVCIIADRCNEFVFKTVFYLTLSTIDELVEKSKIAKAIFLRVLLKAYFCRNERKITSCMNISIIVKVLI